MQVSKWGNSLAIRLPVAVVDTPELKEGDHIEVTIAGPRHFEVRHDRCREAAIARLRRLFFDTTILLYSIAAVDARAEIAGSFCRRADTSACRF
jgi:antitoxin MazE